MAQTGSQVAVRLVGLLSQQDTGVSSILADLADQEAIPQPRLAAPLIRAANIAADLAESTAGAKYPAIHVYCERLSNTLREKFRTFSGKARMTVEARVSQDRLEHIEDYSQLLVDAITTVLDSSRGDWGQGMFYTGGYEVVYGPVKHGGRNFLQLTKVTFEVDVSSN